MADLSKQPFTTASPSLVNFDFVDIANGTGYETYYLIESEDSGGKDYHLTAQTDFSNSILLTINNSTQDNDFDLTPFVIPRTINGTVLISLAIDGDADANYISTVELYRYDGSSETQIGSTVTLISVLSAPKMVYMRMDVDNELIPAGQQLRARVVYSVVGATTGRLGIDPANRADAALTITTTSKISIPYKLDA